MLESLLESLIDCGKAVIGGKAFRGGKAVRDRDKVAMSKVARVEAE